MNFGPESANWNLWRSQTQQAYDSGGDAYVQSWPVPHSWLELERSVFLELVSNEKTILDAGCGPGHDSALWLRAGLKPTGIDLSTKMTSIARVLYPDVEFLNMDVLGLSRLQRTFDCAWAAYMLLHFPQSMLSNALQALSSALRSHGLIFLCSAVTDSTKEVVAPIAGLRDSSGKQISVETTRWSIPDLRDVVGELFKEEWMNVNGDMPNGVDTLCLISRKRG